MNTKSAGQFFFSKFYQHQKNWFRLNMCCVLLLLYTAHVLLTEPGSRGSVIVQYINLTRVTTLSFWYFQLQLTGISLYSDKRLIRFSFYYTNRKILISAFERHLSREISLKIDWVIKYLNLTRRYYGEFSIAPDEYFQVGEYFHVSSNYYHLNNNRVCFVFCCCCWNNNNDDCNTTDLIDLHDARSKQVRQFWLQYPFWLWFLI